MENDITAIALIPTLALMNHKSLFVSNKFGISFDGLLSNTYFYLMKGKRSFDKIYLRGGVSINEIILIKILFAEKYSSDIEIVLDTSKEISISNEYAIVGDVNIYERDFENGISFADQIAEMIDYPYVNFVFASQDKEALQIFHGLIAEADKKIEDEIPDILGSLKLSNSAETFILGNLGSVYFEITQNEVEAINELIKLIYYHGIIKDILDVKFIPSY